MKHQNNFLIKKREYDHHCPGQHTIAKQPLPPSPTMAKPSLKPSFNTPNANRLQKIKMTLNTNQTPTYIYIYNTITHHGQTTITIAIFHGQTTSLKPPL
jgi:hypothetical protein